MTKKLVAFTGALMVLTALFVSAGWYVLMVRPERAELASVRFKLLEADIDAFNKTNEHYQAVFDLETELALAQAELEKIQTQKP